MTRCRWLRRARARSRSHCGQRSGAHMNVSGEILDRARCEQRGPRGYRPRALAPPAHRLSRPERTTALAHTRALHLATCPAAAPSEPPRSPNAPPPLATLHRLCPRDMWAGSLLPRPADPSARPLLLTHYHTSQRAVPQCTPRVGSPPPSTHRGQGSPLIFLWAGTVGAAT